MEYQEFIQQLKENADQAEYEYQQLLKAIIDTQEYQDKFFARVDKTSESGCWLWTGSVNATGYGLFWVRGITLLAHRVSWIMANGPIPYGRIMCHRCDTPPCVNPEHLYAGSHADNATDVVRRNRRSGSRAAKLTEEQVKMIRLSHKSDRALALELNVREMVIYNARAGRTWRHLKDPAPRLPKRWPREVILSRAASAHDDIDTILRKARNGQS